MPLTRRLAHWSLALIAVAVLAGTPAARAHEPPRENLVNFSSSATVEVARDLMTITLQVVKDGGDAASVQAQLKQVLDAALAEAKASAKHGAMDVRTGNFSLYPRHGKDGRISGWQGQADLVLEGKDAPRIAQTAGRLQGMNVVNVSHGISRELAEKHEAEVTAQAIAKYRARAQELAKQFGFGGYALREVHVQTSEPGAPRPMYRRAEMSAMASDAPLPVEPGTGMLSATVSGVVQLMK